MAQIPELIADVAQEYCHVKEMYAVGGMISMAAHTAPRESLGYFQFQQNQENIKHLPVIQGDEFRDSAGQPSDVEFLPAVDCKKQRYPGGEPLGAGTILSDDQ